MWEVEEIQIIVVKKDKWFFDSNKESWIRKLRIDIPNSSHSKSFPTRWIDAVSTRRIEHLDVHFAFCRPEESPSLNIYVCQTLVQLQLQGVALASAEFVTLPSLKIMHLEYISYPNESTLEKLISGSPVLEELTIRTCFFFYKEKVLQVRSHTLKRIHINESSTQFVIDAPLLQCLKAEVIFTKKFQIINSAFPGRLDIDINSTSESLICDILTDISRVRDLVINRRTWKELVKDRLRRHNNLETNGQIESSCVLRRLEPRTLGAPRSTPKRIS
ncbi:predicted protein [Arabidopsis lyrata subsp. lyrata]|uniref:Predicted protein n=1 Tax=Arabidopsis lyrata subsp. lyrata TaxID=81972 RepID=D7MWU8_ARALL|nr:predicted protein [Arabidopsis lyrata subsp. lyrata]